MLVNQSVIDNNDLFERVFIDLKEGIKNSRKHVMSLAAGQKNSCYFAFLNNLLIDDLGLCSIIVQDIEEDGGHDGKDDE